MTYGYIRVSTDKQTVENQRFEISRFCADEKIHIDGWIQETISGTKSYTKRQLGKLLTEVKSGDLIICTELSRLGRNLFMIMQILNICMEKNSRVWTLKEHYRLGDNIESKVLAFAFGLSAEIERNLISQRTKEALSRRRAEGKTLGCPRGKHRRLNLTCKKNHQWIVDELSHKKSKLSIARKLGVSKNTLYRYLAYTGLRNPLACKQKSWLQWGIIH